MRCDPYRRILHGPGRWWASRGYIFIGQHVRGREESSGDVADFGDYGTDIDDGYDAVEWAATLPGANGKVGMIGHSDEGRLVWYAAVSNPPHLAAISPTAATPDPWIIVLAHMAFGPINVDWACLMRGRTMVTNTAELDIGEAIRHLPLATLPQRLGCGDAPLWIASRASHARRILARARGHHIHRQSTGAGPVHGRLARRFARADLLYRLPAAPAAPPRCRDALGGSGEPPRYLRHPSWAASGCR
jgi:hypothetical protein